MPHLLEPVTCQGLDVAVVRLLRRPVDVGLKSEVPVPIVGLRVHLLDEYGVGLIAVDGTDLRVAFSCMEEDNIPELFDTIFKGIKELEE